MSTRRWLDEASDADRFERSILASGLEADPPAQAEGEVWQRVLVAVAPPLGPGPGSGAGGAGGGAAAVTKGATLVTLGKGFLLGVAASVAVAGADRARHHPFAPAGGGAVARTASSAAPARGVLPLAEPVERAALAPSKVGSGDVTPPELAGAPRRVGAAPRSALGPPFESQPGATSAAATSTREGSVAAFPVSDASTSAPRSRLDEEAALLGRARAELRAGALAAAFATLEASRERFSAPELYQEREALLIELLSRSGQRERARERARSFVERFPESPHAAAVRAFADSSQ